MTLIKYLFLGFVLLFSSQVSAEIKLKSTFFGGWKYSLDGQYYKSIGSGAKHLRLEMEGNWLAQWHLDRYRKLHSWGSAAGIPGGFLVGWPIGGVLASGHWNDEYTPMMSIGVPLTLPSIILDSAANRNLKRSVNAYNSSLNEKKTGEVDLPENIFDAKQGLSVRISF